MSNLLGKIKGNPAVCDKYLQSFDDCSSKKIVFKFLKIKINMNLNCYCLELLFWNKCF